MNLYRLDVQHTDGRETGVKDSYGPLLIRSASEAARRASVVAGVVGEPVTITRISGAGLMRRMKYAMPDGTFKRQDHGVTRG